MTADLLWFYVHKAIEAISSYETLQTNERNALMVSQMRQFDEMVKAQGASRSQLFAKLLDLFVRAANQPAPVPAAATAPIAAQTPMELFPKVDPFAAMGRPAGPMPTTEEEQLAAAWKLSRNPSGGWHCHESGRIFNTINDAIYAKTMARQMGLPLDQVVSAMQQQTEP